MASLQTLLGVAGRRGDGHSVSIQEEAIVGGDLRFAHLHQTGNLSSS